MPLTTLPAEWPRAQLEALLSRAGMRATFARDDLARMSVYGDEGDPLPLTMWATPGALRLQAQLTPMPALPEPLAPTLNDSAIDGPWASLAFSRECGLVANLDLYLYPTSVPLGSTLRSATRHLLELRAASLASRPPPAIATPSEVEHPGVREPEVLRAFGSLLGTLAAQPDGSHTARVDYGDEGRWLWRVSFEPSGPVLDAVLDAPPAWTRSASCLRHLAELNSTLAAGALTWWEGGRVIWRRRIAAAYDAMDEHWAKLALDQASNAHLALHRFVGASVRP